MLRYPTEFDPVSRQALPADAAISSVYQGRAYFFESRDNRDAFESDPQKYLAALPMAARPLETSGAGAAQPRRRSGCCWPGP